MQATEMLVVSIHIKMSDLLFKRCIITTKEFNELYNLQGPESARIRLFISNAASQLN